MRQAALLALLLFAAAPALAADPPAAPAAQAAQPAPVPGLVPLAAHQAVYALTLDSSRRGDVSGARGTMAFEIVDACDGWATRQRLQMTVTNRDGQDIEMVSDYATWESKDGLRLRFRMRQTTETAVSEQVEGEAALERPGGPGTVRYTVPEEKQVPLPAGTMFPMTHTEAILKGAVEGKQFLNLPIFDGTGDKGAQDSSVFVGGWQAPMANQYPALAALSSSRVRIAFFARGKPDQSPEYEVGMRYFANGVAEDLLLDFGEFAMKGKLDRLTLPEPHC